jgi:S-methyl-5-thioribose-1-phosphate isomerase
MKIFWKGKIRDIRTLWREGSNVKMINQTVLPHKFEILTLKNSKETSNAIKNMICRGAGAVGCAAGYGMAQAALEAKNLNLTEFIKYLEVAAKQLRNTRPTAVNLFHAIDRCLKAGSEGCIKERVIKVVEEADRIVEEDLDSSKKIGKYGSKLIKKGERVLTHCNAGALAFVDYGTALSPIRFAHLQGKNPFVWVNETRPRCQGARLTVWELLQEGINFALIVDNAAGFFMQKGEIDSVIVGADRITLNGDLVNKIGTYEKAVLAKENNIPFYVAAPGMTFDLNLEFGKEVKIEERGIDEVVKMWGLDENKNITSIQIPVEGITARNPSFDITPAKYITGFITELGIIKSPYRKNIMKYFYTNINSS